MKDVLGRPIKTGDRVAFFVTKDSGLQVGIVEDDGLVTEIMPHPGYDHVIKVRLAMIKDGGLPDFVTRPPETIQWVHDRSYIRQGYGKRVIILSSVAPIST